MGHVSRKDWVAGREGRTKTLEDLSDPCCRHSRSTSRMLSKSLTLPRVCYKKPQGPGTTVRRRQGDRQTCALDAYRPSRRHHVGSFCDPDIRRSHDPERRELPNPSSKPAIRKQGWSRVQWPPPQLPPSHSLPSVRWCAKPPRDSFACLPPDTTVTRV